MIEFQTMDERTRFVELSNGNKLYAKQSDPFGFWTVNFDKGQVPDSLNQTFTTFRHASKAIEAYLKQRKKNLKAD